MLTFCISYFVMNTSINRNSICIIFSTLSRQEIQRFQTTISKTNAKPWKTEIVNKKDNAANIHIMAQYNILYNSAGR